MAEKRLSQSFLASGRLDAEYYHPKYDYLDARLAAMPTKRLGEVVNIRKSMASKDACGVVFREV